MSRSRAVQFAGQTEAISLNRYVKGAVNYLDVATAQETALRTRQQLLTLETSRLQADVSLIRALGGGWGTPGKPTAALLPRPQFNQPALKSLPCSNR